jgi:uncharacterized protein (DUF3820 family)
MMTLQYPYTDHTIMTFGKYAGQKLVNIPGKYFIYLLEKGIAQGGLKKYIEENYDLIIKEADE